MGSTLLKSVRGGQASWPRGEHSERTDSSWPHGRLRPPRRPRVERSRSGRQDRRVRPRSLRGGGL